MHINPTNNSAGLEVKVSGLWFWKKVTLTASFYNGETQRATISHKTLKKDLGSLQDGCKIKYNNNLRCINQNNNELFLFFKPVDDHDLVTVQKQDLLQAIK